MQLPQLLIHIRNQRRVANIRIDLAKRLHPDRHRLQLRMVDICRDNHRPLGNLTSHQLRRNLLLMRDERHLLGHQTLTRKVHLRHIPVARPRRLFLPLHDPLPPRHRHRPVAVMHMPIAVHLASVPIPISAHVSKSPTQRVAQSFHRALRRLLSKEYTPRPLDASQDAAVVSRCFHALHARPQCSHFLPTPAARALPRPHRSLAYETVFR